MLFSVDKSKVIAFLSSLFEKVIWFGDATGRKHNINADKKNNFISFQKITSFVYFCYAAIVTESTERIVNSRKTCKKQLFFVFFKKNLVNLFGCDWKRVGWFVIVESREKKNFSLHFYKNILKYKVLGCKTWFFFLIKNNFVGLFGCDWKRVGGLW